ncbi:hypothetical protein CTAYLR_007000 [Chrysophaeum taylorii]|uniref:Uncharacterized protein n=1 Tax=Chrysophaeum taylorii TaxID=2483200 RepID=A0AAD7XIR0_9STRA|nr:hypothetical protein CTAYLR_007000 [Chrysophaeum taylorii]
MLQGVNAWMRAAPLVTACVVAGAKNSVCDAVVQLCEQKQRFDFRRNATFAVFGVGWVGAGQYWLFNRIYPWVLPGLASRRPGSVAAVTLVDNLGHIPFVYLPVFYTVREVAHGNYGEFLSVALGSWRHNFAEDVGLQAAIFVPAQVFNFAVNPPHLRVPFLVGVGVVWVSLLSHFRGDHPSSSG